MSTFIVNETVVPVRAHTADTDDPHEDAWTLLRGLTTPRVYVSSGSRRHAALNRAFAAVWRCEGPEMARRVPGAGWELWRRAGGNQDGAPPAEARWLAPTIAVLLVVRPATLSILDLRSTTPWRAWDCRSEEPTEFPIRTR